MTTPLDKILQDHRALVADAVIQKYGHDRPITTKLLNRIDEIAKDAIVEAVEGLLPPKRDFNFTSGNSIKMMSEEAFTNGFNEYRDLVLQAIKEWQ